MKFLNKKEVSHLKILIWLIQNKAINNTIIICQNISVVLKKNIAHFSAIFLH